MTIIYFAHAMTDYGTERESTALATIRNRFPVSYIINPSDPEHAAAATAFKRADQNAMDYFLALAREADYLAFLPTHDDKIGPGVMKEIVEVAIFGRPTYEIRLEVPDLIPFNFDRLITIAEIRNRLAERRP